MPKPGHKRWLCIIPVADRAAISQRGIVQQIFGTAGHPHADARDQTFTSELVPASGPGDAAATHYVACAETSTGQYNGLNGLIPQFPNMLLYEYDEVAQFDFPNITIAGLGLKPRTGYP